MARIKPLPSPLVIGHVDYVVSPMSRHDGASLEALGVIEWESERIRIRDELSPARTAEILLHEILHACWRNVSLQGDVEENAVSVLGENLTQVFRDNPHLLKWLAGTLKK